MADVAVFILTYNEELHLERAIESVRPFAKDIFVIDSFSTDDTLAIAKRAGAVVLQNRFVNQAVQCAWALANAPITSQWIMRLDADEVIEADLASRIATQLDSLPAEVTGVNLRRKHIFLGRWLRHGGRYPLTLLRIWRNGKGCVENRWMDEHAYLIEGQATTFDGGFSDWNLNDLTFFIEKHNKYATREAIENLGQRHGLFKRDHDIGSGSKAASAKRWIKEHVYNRIPYPVSAASYFLTRYIVQLGFLDGRPGFVYHVLQGYWYRFLVGAKIAEMEKTLAGCENQAAKIARLSALTGYDLADLA